MRTLSPSTWTVDPAHSSIEFAIKHLVVATVRGLFTLQEATVSIGDGGAATVSAVIDAASVNTGNATRDGHLRSGDFFDVERFPTATFVASFPARTVATPVEVTGSLTLKGVNAPVTLVLDELAEGENMAGAPLIALSGRTTINRRDFGIDFELPLPSGIKAVGDTVELRFDLEASLQA